MVDVYSGTDGSLLWSYQAQEDLECLVDANGDGSITLNFAPGTTGSLLGRTFWMAAVGYEWTSWGDRYLHGVSVAASLSFVP